MDRRNFLRSGGVLAAGAAALAPNSADAANIDQPSAGTAPASTFNIVSYGAVGDGNTDKVAANTAAINRAITAASQAGGGTVLIPPGVYYTGPFRLLSHVTVYLEAGSTIKGSPRLEDYRTVGPETGLISANGAQNIALLGRGTIDGNSIVYMSPEPTPFDFGDKKFTRQGEDYMSPKFGNQTSPFTAKDRPGKMIHIVKCQDVLIAGVTIQNSPNWTMAFEDTHNVNILGACISNVSDNLRDPNDDGTDITNCSNFHVADCDYQTADDCFALFAVENMTVTNCTLRSRSAGIRVGFDQRLIRNVTFSNIAIHESNRGINVNVRSDGVIENMLFDNITIQTQLSTGNWWGKAEPIHISSISKPGSTPGSIRNLRFSNIIAEGENGILLFGTRDSVLKDITFDNIRLKVKNGPLLEAYGGNFDFRDTGDPQTDIYKHDIPGFYAHSVDGLKIRNFELEWEDNLPAFFNYGIQCEDGQNIVIDGFEGRQAHLDSADSAISLSNCNGVTIRNCMAAEGTQTFLAHSSVEGKLFVNNDLSQARATFSPTKADFTLFGNLEPSLSLARKS
jgi:polygalacturonase